MFLEQNTYVNSLKMKNEYIVLNSVQSHLITWGNPFHSNGKDIIICITGNPGITDYYIEFASELHKITGLPLCIIGQAGHEVVPDKNSNYLKDQEHLFDLKGQILHKADLINNYIDKRSRLHLIGHSIGAWLILELLQDNVNLTQRIASINLLFPTLQRMVETRNGKFLNSVLRSCHVVLLLLYQIAYICPKFIIKLFIIIYLKLYNLPLYYQERTLKFLNPKVGEKVLFLAYNEMDIVKRLNIEALDNIKHLTNVIYSSKDNWAPVHYMDDLKLFQPSLQLRQVDVDHAFVLKSSNFVSGLVSEFIKAKMT